MKSQSAIEFLSIVSLGLVILIATSFLGYNYVQNYFFDTNSLNARQMVSVTTSAANLIYSQGVNASTKVKINMPSDMVRNRTYLHEKEINIRFSDPPRDALDSAATSLYGTIPFRAGTNVLYLKMTSDGVRLMVEDSVALVDVRTYNNTARTSEYKTNTFTSSDTVYYKVNLQNFTESPVDHDLNIHIYSPDGMLNSSFTAVTSGGENKTLSITPGSSAGSWLISVLIDDEKVLGTALFIVS